MRTAGTKFRVLIVEDNACPARGLEDYARAASR